MKALITAKHRWARACSKLIDEVLALACWNERRLPVVIVRLFNTVGPRQTGQYRMAGEPRAVGDMKSQSLIGFTPKMGLNDIIRSVVEPQRRHEKSVERPVY